MTALLAGKSLRQVATTTGVSERTLYNWLNDADFCQELQVLERQHFDGVSRALLAVATASAAVLGAVATDTTQPGAVRVRAAQAAIDAMLRVVELRTLTARVEALERILNQ